MNLQFLESVASTTKVPKGSLVLAQDDLPRTGYVVKGGIVRVYNVTAAGEERVISFKLKGDVFLLGWLFSKHERALYFYEAFTDCELYAIPKQQFVNLVETDKNVNRDLLDFLVNEHIASGLRINALERSHSRDKVVHVLQTLCLRYGKEVQKDIVRIQLPLRQQDIADLIGMTRETTALELAELKRRGVIDYRRMVYTVHTDLLNDLLDDEYDPGIHL